MTAITLIGIFWAIFIVVWLVSAASSKRTIYRGSWWYGAIIRVVVLVIIISLLQSSNAQYLRILSVGHYSGAVAYLGVLLCVAGLAFAIWARVHLGKNWGMPMTLKENPELVTSGPYRFIRNPIYTGMLFAMFGSALVIGSIWFAVFIVSGIYFIYSAKQEEKIMAGEFPDQYPAYKKRTKALIPFVW